MRVTLDDDDLALVRDALTSLAEGDAHPDAERAGKMRERFTPEERVRAEVREHVWPFVVRELGGGHFSPVDEYKTVEEAREAAETYTARWANVEGADRVYEVVSVHPARRERLLTCPVCGGTEFGFMEGCEDYRTPSGQTVDGDGGTVTVYWSADGTADSGDSDPGLFCDNYQGGGCGVPIDLPDGWEINHQ